MAACLMDKSVIRDCPFSIFQMIRFVWAAKFFYMIDQGSEIVSTLFPCIDRKTVIYKACLHVMISGHDVFVLSSTYASRIDARKML